MTTPNPLTNQAQRQTRPVGGMFSQNVGDVERKLSAIAGGALAAYGVGRGPLRGLLHILGGGFLLYRGITGHCGAYQALDISTAPRKRDKPTPPDDFFKHGTHVQVVFTINKPRADLYRYWRQLDNLPRFMTHLKSVEILDDKRSHWVADAPAGLAVAWDAEIINDEPNSLIAWRSLNGGDVDTAGSVRFTDAPADRGTEVNVTMEYIPPGGRVGAAIAKLMGHGAESEIREDLRRFKQIAEAGELPTTEGQPHGA